MKRSALIHLQLAGCLLLAATHPLNAQELNSQPAPSWSTPNKPSIPAGTPTALSDQAFQTKVRTQSADTKKQLEKETESIIAKLENDSKQKARPPEEFTDSNQDTTSPNDQMVAPNNNPPAMTNGQNMAPTSTYGTPPATQSAPTNNYVAPQNNQQPTQNKGGWQIQY